MGDVEYNSIGDSQNKGLPNSPAPEKKTPEVPTVNPPVSSMSELNLPTVGEKRPVENREGIAKRIIARSKEEEQPMQTSEVPATENPEAPTTEKPPINENTETKKKKGFDKLLLIGLILVAAILLMGSIYLLLRDSGDSGPAISANTNSTNSTDNSINNSIAYDLPITENSSEGNPDLLEPSDFNMRILRINCSNEEIKVTAKLNQGNLDAVVFDVYFGNESVELVDDNPMNETQTKEFQIFIAEVDEAPWKIELSGMSEGSKYGVMDSQNC